MRNRSRELDDEVRRRIAHTCQGVETKMEIYDVEEVGSACASATCPIRLSLSFPPPSRLGSASECECAHAMQSLHQVHHHLVIYKFAVVSRACVYLGAIISPLEEFCRFYAHLRCLRCAPESASQPVCLV